MITGENGTGKERSIENSIGVVLLAKQPYIRVNCAAISETLMESEFLVMKKDPLLVLLKGGKDGLNSRMAELFYWMKLVRISSALQAKLLRVLQEKEFERVGGTKRFR